MHRSGTSLVANLLHECGLYLGRKRDLLPPSADNENGYWEIRKFVNLNDAILRTFGGSWNCQPVARAECFENENLNALRVKAEILIRDFVDREPWGWKDPRSSLTLPFWMNLNGLGTPFWSRSGPKLKIVVCLRNPVEVFESLEVRRFTPSAAGLDLWLTYNQDILNATLPEERIITHYESYFRDGGAELRRVLDFLNMPASAEVISRSLGIVSKVLRHKAFHGSLAGRVSGEIQDLYALMCREANYD